MKSNFLPQYLDRIFSAKSQFTEEEWTARPAPGKWSKQEILGHLVDSAVNNLKRFTEVNAQDENYYLIAYPQDHLVQANHYNELPWSRIFDLLNALNLQIHFVIENYEPAILSRTVINHNGDIFNLQEWIADYYNHFEHHLSQIFGNQFIQ